MFLLCQKGSLARVLLALDWKTVVDMTISLQLVHQWHPDVSTFAAIGEGIRIPDDQQSVARTGQHDVDTLRR